jgi:hypothetical protein
LVEISFTETLNHIITSTSQLSDFLERLESIIQELESLDNDNQSFALQITNFPPMINIYFDESLLRKKFGSYYLHNKVISIGYLIRWANS